MAIVNNVMSHQRRALCSFVVPFAVPLPARQKTPAASKGEFLPRLCPSL